VLIRIRAAALNPLDWRMMRGKPYLLRFLAGVSESKVKRPGVDFAGVVEAAGNKVTQWKQGDEVFGACDGALAEFARVPGSKVARKPATVSFEQAASVPVAGLTALQGLRDRGRLQPGQKVLINGAAGGVGTFAVQIARTMGADITGVCSTNNVEMVRSLGAQRVIDYTRENVTRSGERYDVILDNVGNLPLLACRRMLKPAGRCVIAGGPKRIGVIFARALGAIVLSWFGKQKLGFFVAKIDPGQLAEIGELIASGKITPMIDRRCDFSESAEAMRYLETGHARGKVVIAIDGAAKSGSPAQFTAR
jgi:NADPH:quinone reductase-like Zn-dependent oxidoreductase